MRITTWSSSSSSSSERDLRGISPFGLAGPPSTAGRVRLMLRKERRARLCLCKRRGGAKTMTARISRAGFDR